MIDKSKIVATSKDLSKPTSKEVADVDAQKAYEQGPEEAIKKNSARYKAGASTSTFFISPIVLKDKKEK